MGNNTQINTSYNADRSKCTIAEYEAGTHRKIRTIETLKGFAVDLSYKCYAETFWINAFGEIKDERGKKAVFDNYYKHLFQKHKNKTISIDRLSKTVFLKETYKSEVENLEKFKKYINYFDIIKNKDNFLQYCDNFILWLERKQTKKPKKGKPYKSYYRAVAIYFKMKFDFEGKTIPQGKQFFWGLVKEWKQPSGKYLNQNEFYKMFAVGNEPIANQSYIHLKDNFPKDYSYAITIFRKKHGKEFNPKDYTK